jgi:hypothetical protein
MGTTRGPRSHRLHYGRTARFFDGEDISLRVTYSEDTLVLPPNATYLDANPKARPYIWAANATSEKGFQLLYSTGSGTKEHIYKANSVQPSLGIGESLLFGNPLYWTDSGTNLSIGDISISNNSNTLISDIDQIGNKWEIVSRSAIAGASGLPTGHGSPKNAFSAFDYPGAPVMQSEVIYYSNVTPNVAVTASGREWGDVASGAPIDMPFIRYEGSDPIYDKGWTALLWITTNADGSPMPSGESKMYTYFANDSFNLVRMLTPTFLYPGVPFIPDYTVNCGLGNSMNPLDEWEYFAGGGGPEGPNNCSWVGMDTKGMWVNSMGGIIWTSNGIWGEGQHWP